MNAMAIVFWVLIGYCCIGGYYIFSVPLDLLLRCRGDWLLHISFPLWVVWRESMGFILVSMLKCSKALVKGADKCATRAEVLERSIG